MDVRRLYREQLEETRSRRTDGGETDPTTCDVGALVDLAFKELETARAKAEATLATARQQASRIYRDARRDVRGFLGKARERAGRLEEAGEARASAAMARVEDEARRRGVEEGREEGRAQVREALAAAEALVAAAGAERERLLTAVREDFARVVMAALRRVVGALRDADEGLLARCLAEVARSRFAPGESLEVRLNPADLELVEKALEGSPGLALTFSPDGALPSGACRVVGETTALSLSLEDRLEALERELRAALELEPGDGA